MANKSNWKGRERRIARDFGGERTPLSGGNSKHTRGDVIHDLIYFESKHQQGQAIVKLHKNTTKKAFHEKKIPLTIVSEKGLRGYYVVCHISDLEAISNVYTQVKKERL